MNTSKYYTPSVEEFHIGFRYESGNKATRGTSTKWFKEQAETLDLIETICEVRVKYLDQQDIEELGWTYTGKSTELWFGIPETNVQPFNLIYRSFRLSYNLTDFRCYIIGYEYNNYVGEDEPLFLGKIKNYNELKQIMKFLNIIE